jgi:selenide, water dikinase
MAVDRYLSPAVPARLTELSACGGCGAKLAAAELLPLIDGLSAAPDGRVLVDMTTADDAGVYGLGDGLALVQTVDFFTPLVDDSYDFGRIAAANALSDVYAMGGRPITAMNIVAFPLQELGPEPLRDILRGGADVVRSAHAALLGGHSIRDSEPKYGLAVTGVVDPKTMTTNAAAREGDAIVLTKPLGAGAIVTANMRGDVSGELLAAAVEVMVELNDKAAEAAVRAGVRAMTDVTGFGLLGHLHRLTKQSGLAADIDAAAVPSIPGVEQLLSEGLGISSGSRRNAEWAAGFAASAGSCESWRMCLLSDATTSGGLLMAVPAGAGEVELGTTIGRLRAGVPGEVLVW